MLNKILKFLSKISVRLLLFNVLLVIIPLAFLFYLDIYEKKLLSAQEHAMVQQGRIMSSALSGTNSLDREAQRILNNLNKRQEARIRIIDRDGIVVADSALIGGGITPVKVVNSTRSYSSEAGYTETATLKKSNDSNFLYSMVRTSLDFIRYFIRGPRDDRGVIEYYSGRNMLEGREVQAALSGRYGATTRISRGGQRSITMYSAIPVESDGRVIGVVLVSQSTYRILQNLYQIRLEILKIFLICLAAACIISFILSRTIAGPLKKLRNQAREITDNRGRITSHFKTIRNRDEIGDLNDSLQDLTKKLHSHLLQTEAFASDVSHEFKNPLASIQSATELLRDSEDTDRSRFINIISQEASRLERLISGVREISVIDVKLNEEERTSIEPLEILEAVISNFKIKTSHIELKFKIERNFEDEIKIVFAPERFVQVLENIIANAVSFSPIGGEISVFINKEADFLLISVCDDGPGIPKENMDKIFNRFFTYRKNRNAGSRNSGLGLSICEVIIKGYGGSIIPGNITGRGAEFKILIPMAK